ncbi:MAG TPA: ferredoxin [Acidimicrobiales bacterium]|nr:ferredoxin [Acidimicrobiales bacterium]
MKLRIDPDACTGHGRCYSLAPELFDADEYGHGQVKVAEVGEGELEAARLAEANCPERAISLEP